MSGTDPHEPYPPGPDRTSAGAGGAWLLAEAASAAANARARLDVTLTDLFLPEAGRLSDLHRTTMRRLLRGLIERIERDLRARLVARGEPALAAALDEADGLVAAPRLARAGVLRDGDLAALLLRRAEERRLVQALAFHAARDHLPPPRFLDDLPEPLAGAVADFLAADGRRQDAFHDLAPAEADLPADLQYKLVWWVAAALRGHLIGEAGLAPGLVDPALAGAARDALAGYDEGETLEGRAMRLARGLHAAGRLDDEAVARMLAAGAVALAVAGLAARAGIAFASAWDMVAEADGSRLVLLLRAIDMARAPAADIVFRLAVAGGGDAGDAAAGRIEAFAAMAGEAARVALLPWRLDEGYRRAIADLSVSEVAR
jgi:hypothetical protein